MSKHCTYIFTSEGNNVIGSNNSVKKKFEKGRKVPGLLKKQAKRPLKISFKPCDILTGASLGIFHLGSKPIAV